MASVKVPLSAGGIIPRDLNARQFSEWASSQSTKNIFAGATGYNSGTGVWFGEDTDGTVKWFVGDASGNKVTWDGSTLSITGTITATTGTIGGWTLGSTALTSGSGANTVGLDSGGTNPAIYAGSATPASAPFRVTQAGALTASNATITGSVTSTSGTIGGWTLAATSLTSGTGASTVGIDSGGTNPAFYAGSATPGSAPFRVTQAGALTATSATITGAVNLTNSAQTFTPTWTAGFSTDPSGDISYLDLGKIVWMWVDSALTGVSDDQFMQLSGVPVDIRPSASRYIRCFLLDESNLRAGVAVVTQTGAITFSLEVVETSPTDSIGFDNVFTFPSVAGSKGLPGGWIIQYAK